MARVTHAIKPLNRLTNLQQQIAKAQAKNSSLKMYKSLEYPKELKKRVVRYVMDRLSATDEELQQVADDLGIHRAVLIIWYSEECYKVPLQTQTQTQI